MFFFQNPKKHDFLRFFWVFAHVLPNSGQRCLRADADDLGNYTQVAYYLLQFHIEAEFNPELENTSSDIYRRYNETLSPLVSAAV